MLTRGDTSFLVLTGLRRGLWLACATMILVVTLPNDAFAQEGEEPVADRPAQTEANDMMLDEIVVTAQKRVEFLQDVPISIIAMDRDALEIRRIEQIKDLGANIPNLFVNSFNNDPTSVRLFIRGIGQNDVQITQDPSVALYQDGVYIGTSVGSGFEGVDMERVEVLRGPQGTLYGRNATGGAVNIITRRADVHEWGFRQELTGGEWGTFKSKTMINVPIADKFAVKLNYLHSERDGYVENNGLGEDFAGEDRDVLVLDLRAQVTDNFVIDYRYENTQQEDTQRYEQVTELTPGTGVLGGLVTWSPVHSDRQDKITSLFDIRKNDLEINAHALFLTWDISDQLTLKSITSRREFDSKTYHNGHPTGVIVIGSGEINVGINKVAFEQTSQEFQLLGETDRFEYVVGLYYYEDKSSHDSSETISLGRALADSGLQDFTSAANDSIAAFGQATWTPGMMESRWHFTLGGRYSKDHREAYRINDRSFGQQFEGPYDNDFENFNPTLTVAFDINDDMNIYGKVVSGYKSGGTSLRSANAISFAVGFDEEEILSYELGIKGTFWNSRARLSAAIFHMDLDGMQTSVQTGLTPGERDFLPVDGNTIDGLELDMSLLLAEGLTLDLGYGYLDTEVGEDSVDSPAGTFFLTDAMSFAPKHSATAQLNYKRPLSIGAIGFNAYYNWQDEVNTSLNTADNIKIDSYGILGGSISWSDITIGNLPGDFRIMLWGQNLMDEEYATVKTSAWSFVDATETTTFGDPRRIGLTAIYEF